MRLRKTSTRLLAASLCLAVAVTCTGCGGSGGGPIPNASTSIATSTSQATSAPSVSSSSSVESVSSSSSPSSSSSSTASSAEVPSSSENKPLTEEELIQKKVNEACENPSNESASWISKPGYVFVAMEYDTGRLYNGKWLDYKEAYRILNNYHGRVALRSIPDDSIGGSNCVWNYIGSTLSYYPVNANDPNTYVKRNGWVFTCYVAKDGTIYNGSLQVLSEVKQKYDLYLEYFPYNIQDYGGTDYVYNGSSLEYKPVRTCNPNEWPDHDGTIAVYSLDESNRVHIKCYGKPLSSPDEYISTFYPGCSWMSEYPEYISSNCILNGNTLIYYSIHK